MAENYIRTLTDYQIGELRLLFLMYKITHIGREDETGHLIVEYVQPTPQMDMLTTERIKMYPDAELETNVWRGQKK